MKKPISLVLGALSLVVSLRSALYGLFIQSDTWTSFVHLDDLVSAAAIQAKSSTTNASAATTRTRSSANVAPNNRTKASARGIFVTHRSNSSATDNAQKKPLFILHAGPSKTGTTTIQYFSAEHERLLQKDNIYYLGHFKNETRPELNLHVLNDMCYSCKGETCKSCDEKWNEFEESVKYHYSLGHNVFVSNEMFSGFRKEEYEKRHLWDRLTPMLQNWNVRLVYAYRRYHEWVPSKYFQLYNPNSEKKGGKWPDDGGRRTPLFPDYYENHRQDTFKHPGLVKKKWASYFPNVWVFNMHQQGNLLSRFYRQMLPEAKHALDYLATRNNASFTFNPSTNKVLHYDMIAVEAYTRGWVDKTHSRTEVREAVRRYAEELGLASLSDFPLKCLSSTQAKVFLNESLTMEKEMVPKFYASFKGKYLKEGFSEASKKSKFCSVDVDPVLKEKRWREFFRINFGGVHD